MATRLVWMGILMGIGGISSLAWAQPPVAPPPRPTPPPVYNGIIAGWEAYFRGETERQQAIGTQLSANDSAAWYNGSPTTVPYPPDLETVYATGPTLAFRPGKPGLTYAHRGCVGVFEPWPLVPGDIWGYPYRRRVAQPVGNSITPLGPNGYFARSVYPADTIHLQPALAGPAVTLPAAVPQANGPVAPADPGTVEAPPPDAVPATPAPEAVPTPVPEDSGPREF